MQNIISTLLNLISSEQTVKVVSNRDQALVCNFNDNYYGDQLCTTQKQ